MPPDFRTSARGHVGSGVLTPERSEFIAQTRRALATLTASQREVLMLCYFDHLTQAQTAIRLSMPVPKVKTAAATGLRQLAAAIEGWGLAEPI